MKIRDIRTFPVRIGRGSRSGSRAEFHCQLVVKVDTDAGLYGVGESDLSGREQGPRLLVPDPPGLGVEFDEAAAKRHDYRVISQAQLRRDDGSITNW